MSSSVRIEHLNLSELNILLGHLRLGEAHLKDQLSKEQFNSLLHLGSLNLEQKINVSSNKAEKSGNVALVLNTIITSVFGAWMGFSGFAGLRLNSPVTLACITGIALIISLLVGYFSFKLTAVNAQSAIYKQKIHNVQINVLKLIISKQQDSLESLIKYLNHSVNYLKAKSQNTSFFLKKEEGNEKPLVNFDTPEEFSTLMIDLTGAIQEKIKEISRKKIYNFYKERLLKIIVNLDKKIMQTLFINHSGQNNNISRSLDHKMSFIQILSTQADQSTVSKPRKNWFKDNILALAAGSIPTLLGGFASMFVFLAGGPNLAKELGFINLEHSLRNPHSQMIELGMAVLLTLYFGISFIYNNYKNYIRQHEIEKSIRELVLLEKEDIYLKRKFTLLTKIKSETRRIINIYTAIENIEEYYREEELM
ncbi:MAG TPA: hypothetical protein PK657_11715 [Legionella sp.]|nr:hypothetical protein [Legionella sp.]